MLVQRFRLRDASWAPLLIALLLTATGVAFVISAKLDADARYGIAQEGRMQLAWWGLSLGVCLLAAHVPLALWRAIAFPAYAVALLILLGMAALADTPLVPSIKGQHNWLKLGPVTLQPSEFVKIGVLLGCARLVSIPGFQVGRIAHIAGAMAFAGFPAAILAREDLGSAITFPPMILGILIMAGMRLRHLGLIVLCMALTITAGVAALPKEGPKAYQYQRIQAWLHPDQYKLAESYQTIRGMSAIGSGQLTGKGWGKGVAQVPERHTDMIFTVVGEESGFVGSSLTLLLLLAFGWSGVAAAARCRDPFGQACIAGFCSLLMGQAGINLAVATGLMPVTGVTLPFFSYGGSSLLGTYLGLGLLIAASVGGRGGRRESGRLRSTRR